MFAATRSSPVYTQQIRAVLSSNAAKHRTIRPYIQLQCFSQLQQPKPVGKVWCDAVYVKESNLCQKLDRKFNGVFTRKDIQVGELIECGIMKRLPSDFDGMSDQFVFTWSDDIPNTTWAFGSGCATFYNTGRETANCKMIRNFDTDTFEIIATRDIQKDEELYHQYKSLEWRTCFKDVAKMAQ